MGVKLRPIHQTAPITALAVLPGSAPVLLAGTASTILALSLSPTPGQTHHARALERDRVHAIIAVHDVDTELARTRWSVLAVGGREAALLSVELGPDKEISIQRLWFMATPDWVHSAAFISTTSIVLITAHNSVLQYNLDSFSPSTAPTLVHTYHCPLRPLLWTASFSRAQYGALSEVVAGAGSMIGDALCFNLASTTSSPSDSYSAETTLPPSCVSCLRGHHGDPGTEYRNFMGAVFCLAFSEDGTRILTGSDDRTVRLWHIPQTEEQGDRQEDGSTVIGPSRTLWGHEGRVWRLSWIDNETIASVAEDTTCRVWSLAEADQADPVISTFKDGHDGRSIWALASCEVEGVQVAVTGGADGAIRSWALGERRSGSEEVHKEGGCFLGLDVGSPIRSFAAAELEGEGQVGLVVTKLGQLYSTPLPPPTTTAPKLLFESTALRAPCLLHLTSNRILLISNLGFLLTIDRATGEVGHAETAVAAVAWDLSADGRTMALYERRGARVVVLDLTHLLNGTGALRVVGELGLERKMVLRGVKLSPDGELLLLGSQSGAILLCATTPHAAASSGTPAALPLLGRLDNSHSATVNQFLFLRPLSIGQGWDIESVGRDGNVAVHRIERAADQVACSLRTLQSRSISRGDVSQILPPTIEDGERRYLALVESTALVVDAAGSTLSQFVSPGRYDPLVVCSSRGVDLYRTINDKVHHQFAAQKKPSPPGVLRARLHGREVRSIALESFSTATGTAELMVTGAENAVLRVSRVDKDGTLTSLWEDPQPVAAVKAVAVSSHDEAGPHWLFEAGACEHLRAFRLDVHDAPVPGSAETAVQTRVRSAGSRPSVTGSEGEVRVMDLWVGPLEGARGVHWGVTGYSDGFVRVWTYDERTAKFTRVAESGAHGRCLLSLKMVQIPGVGEAGWVLFSAGTDGLVAVWDLTTLRKQLIKATAIQLSLGEPILTYRPHLSGVNGLDAVYDERDFSIVLATAGDDNALTLARVQLSPAPAVRTLSRVPNAHSSTIQGLSFLSPGMLVSSCVDQRLSVWSVFTARADGVRVRDRAVLKLALTRELAVADCSAMSILKRAGEGRWLVGVAGIGLELLELETEEL